MLTEAVSEARGEPVVAYPEVRVDLPLAAYLPEEYVPATDLRVRFYRRMAGSPTVEGVDAVARELREEFGAPPETARNLLDIARIRALAAEAGATNVAVVRRRLQISPIDLDDEHRGKLAAHGALYLERERKVVVPLEYGASVTETALGTLDAILSPV